MPSTRPALPTPPWLPSALVLLAVWVYYGGQAWLHPLQYQLGSALSEAPGHLWGLWATADRLCQSGPFLREAPGIGFPTGFKGHLMDPINLLLFLPGFWLAGGGLAGASLGWNLLHTGALLVGAVGSWKLARSLAAPAEPHPWAAATMVGAFVAGAFLLSHPHMGRTEYLPVVLAPWHVALLMRWVRGQGSWRTGLGAGVLLGAIGLGGSYISVFILLMEIPLALGLLLVGPQRARRLGRLAAMALVALLVALPAPLALMAHPPSDIVSLVSPPPMKRVAVDLALLFKVFRMGGRPILSPFLDQPVYPGVVVLFLGLLGALLRPRRALPWLLLGFWLLSLALGPAFALEGKRQLLMPAGFLREWFPPLLNIKEWSRLGCLVPLPLGAAAFHGVTALFERLGSRLRTGLGLAFTVLVLLDQATWPRAWNEPRPVFQAQAPADLLAVVHALPPGAILQLPLEVSMGRGVKLEAGIYALWQLQHRRPITATPEVISDTALRYSWLGRLAANRQFAESGELVRRRNNQLPPGAEGALDKDQRTCAQQDAAALAAQGVAGIVVYLDRFAGQSLVDLLEPALGPVQQRSGEVVAWDLPTLVAENGWRNTGICAPMTVAPNVQMKLDLDRAARRRQQ